MSDPTPAEAIATRQVLGLDKTVSLVKVEIHDADGRLTYFITTLPQATPYTPPGRATHTFQVYDVL
jgi:hypothetical protein